MKLCITPKEFERQMKYLADKNFNVVSLDTLMMYKEKRHIPHKTVAITFDDGYRDNYTDAFPVLQKYGFPATIFLATSELGGIRTMHDVDFEILSKDQLRELHVKGITIGAHSLNHKRLNQLSGPELNMEVMESKAIIEKIVGTSCLHFAYPHGRFNIETIRSLRDAGFAYGYGTQDGLVCPETPLYQIKRNTVAATSFGEFKNIIRVGRISRARWKPFLKEKLS